MSVHSECEYYVEQNDMCLLYFQFGFHEVSQYTQCLGETIYGDSE